MGYWTINKNIVEQTQTFLGESGFDWKCVGTSSDCKQNKMNCQMNEIGIHLLN